MNFKSTTIFSLFVIILLSFSISAQNKKNSRPTESEDKKTQDKVSEFKGETPVYFYEFSQPKFIVSKVTIEHDEFGVGKITFQKRDYDEDFVEPLKLSEKSLEIFKELWTELNFLNSDEVYQSKERDYGHLGTIKLRMNKDSKERDTEFNWTENINAKALANEYRKITNQYIWMFDMNVARENQPLESPKIMKSIDSYLKRDQISDPQQMIPYLKDLSDDERVPMITRNYAARLLKNIETHQKDKK